MKFAIIGHLITNQKKTEVPKGWSRHNNLLISPCLNFNGTRGFGISMLLTPEEMIKQPRDVIHEQILNACFYATEELNVDIVQLGGLTTSVTSGGVWVADQDDFHGYVNHGDSFTAAITCQNVLNAIKTKGKSADDLVLAIVGAYGIIGEAVSQLLVPRFKKSILVGRRKDKLEELSATINGNFQTSLVLDIKKADVVVTATSHPTALLTSEQLKENAIVIDVSQPPNVSIELCKNRPDVFRIDGGFVDSPTEFNVPLMPKGKIFACIAEVIMQAMEGEKGNHVGSIDLNHLYKTEKWAEKHGFLLNELTNFGQTVFTL